MNNDPAERVERLEAHLAHLERQVEQLNEVIVEQSKEIDRLKLQIRRVSETMETMEIDRIKSTNAKPPHYQ
jgi:uncharacterized coiled-coil protein SlyX